MKVSVPLPTAVEGGCWGKCRVSSTPMSMTQTSGGTHPLPISHCSGLMGVKGQNPDSSEGGVAGTGLPLTPSLPGSIYGKFWWFIC